jgi:hypothetical protein
LTRCHIINLCIELWTIVSQKVPYWLHRVFQIQNSKSSRHFQGSTLSTHPTSLCVRSLAMAEGEEAEVEVEAEAEVWVASWSCLSCFFELLLEVVWVILWVASWSCLSCFFELFELFLWVASNPGLKPLSQTLALIETLLEAFTCLKPSLAWNPRWNPHSLKSSLAWKPSVRIRISVAPMAEERNSHAEPSCILVFVIEVLFHLCWLFCFFELPLDVVWDYLCFVLLTSSLPFVCFITLFSWPLKFVETLALASNPCLKPLPQTLAIICLKPINLPQTLAITCLKPINLPQTLDLKPSLAWNPLISSNHEIVTFFIQNPDSPLPQTMAITCLKPIDLPHLEYILSHLEYTCLKLLLETLA